MLSYANVVASVALFIALGGTAAAAVTLDRDSVGSREIRDGGVRIADVSTGARGALLGDVRFVDRGRTVDLLDTCAGFDVTECPDAVELELEEDSDEPGPLKDLGGPGSNWLVQAKLQPGGARGDSEVANRCGLVGVRSPGTALLLDEVQFDPAGLEAIALSAVVRKRAGNPTVAVRCTSQPGDNLHVAFAKITALEVGRPTDAG